MTRKQPDFTETILSSKTVYRGQLLHVLEDEVRLPIGGGARREYIRHPGAAMIIALLDEDTLLLERQFRYPLGRHFYELPAGKLESGEEPLATAKRELIEECGYEAASWRHLATLHPCIGYSDERIDLFLARGLKYVGHAPDDGEFLEVVPMKIAEALEWVRLGKITEAKAVTGILWAEKLQRGDWQ
jgi:ADP-ribose pyrophosphatase